MEPPLIAALRHFPPGSKLSSLRPWSHCILYQMWWCTCYICTGQFTPLRVLAISYACDVWLVMFWLRDVLPAMCCRRPAVRVIWSPNSGRHVFKEFPPSLVHYHSTVRSVLFSTPRFTPLHYGGRQNNHKMHSNINKRYLRTRNLRHMSHTSAYGFAFERTRCPRKNSQTNQMCAP